MRGGQSYDVETPPDVEAQRIDADEHRVLHIESRRVQAGALQGVGMVPVDLPAESCFLRGELIGADELVAVDDTPCPRS